MTGMVRNGFNYESLASETRTVVEQRTEEIKVLMRRTAHDILEIGQKLTDVKLRLGHGNWLGWLEVEFEWGDQTARNFMNVAKNFGQIQNGFDFAPRALYALAAPSAPEPARKEALARAKVGETITHVKAKEIISRGKPESAPATVETIIRLPPCSVRDVFRVRFEE